MDWQPISTAPLDTPILFWLPARDEQGAIFSVWPGIITRCVHDDGDSELIYDIPSFDEKHGIGYDINSTVPDYWCPMLQGPA